MSSFLEAQQVASKRSSGSTPRQGVVVSVGRGIAQVKSGGGIFSCKFNASDRVEVRNNVTFLRSIVGRAWTIDSVLVEGANGADSKPTMNGSGIINAGANVGVNITALTFSTVDKYQVWTEIGDSLVIKTTRPTLLITGSIEVRITSTSGSGDYRLRFALNDQAVISHQSGLIRANFNASTFSFVIPFTSVITGLAPGTHDIVSEFLLESATATLGISARLISMTAVEL